MEQGWEKDMPARRPQLVLHCKTFVTSGQKFCFTSTIRISHPPIDKRASISQPITLTLLSRHAALDFFFSSTPTIPKNIRFSSDAPMNTPPASPDDSTPANDEPLVLGPSTAVNGAIELPGVLIIQGLLEGRVTADKVIIGRNGTVSGTVIASEVVVDGEAVDILILADRIVLRNGSYVTGAIWHEELVLEAGHLFEGKSRRHANPRSLESTLLECTVESDPDDEESDSATADA